MVGLDLGQLRGMPVWWWQEAAGLEMAVHVKAAVAGGKAAWCDVAAAVKQRQGNKIVDV